MRAQWQRCRPPSPCFALKSPVLELIRNDVQFPPGMMIFEDPPLHDAHRALIARVFTPRRIAQIEPRVRAYCARSLDPLVGRGRIDFEGTSEAAKDAEEFQASYLGFNR